MPHKDPIVRAKYQSERSKTRRRKNPEKARAYERAWYAKNKERLDSSKRQWRKIHAASVRIYARRTLLKTKYGIDETAYLEMLKSQGGTCAICKSDVPGSGRKFFCVDHDHNTGRVRALLCVMCNAGLGAFRDSGALLGAASAYLIVQTQIADAPPRRARVSAQADLFAEISP